LGTPTAFLVTVQRVENGALSFWTRLKGL